MDKLKNICKKNVNVIAAFLSVVAVYTLWIYFTYGPAGTGGRDTVWCFVAVGMCLIIRQALIITGKHFRKLIWILGCFFSLIIVLGHIFSLHGNTDAYMSVTGFAVFLFLIVGFTIIVGSLLVVLYDCLDRVNIREQMLPRIIYSNRILFYIIWALIFCCHAIYLCWFYPAILTTDSISQINQCLSGVYTNHHPFVNTVMISLVIQCVKWCGGGLALSIAVFSALQSGVMALIFTYAISFFLKRRLNKYVLLSLLLYYALFPINAMYSITLWKDILFGGICLLLIILMMRLVDNPESIIKNKITLFFFGLIIFLFCLFRNNGFYAFVVFVPIMILMNKKYWKQLLILSIVEIAAVLCYLAVLLPLLDVKKADMKEGLSVPLQQIARTLREHGNDLSFEDKYAIREILDTDSLAQLYVPYISDPVKAKFNEDKFKEEPMKYIRLWASLLKKYPKTYIESFFAGMYGYIDPSVDASFRPAFSVMKDIDTKTYFKKTDIAYDLYPNFKKMLRLVFRVPIISIFFNIGFMIWIALIIMLKCIMDKKYKLLLPFYFLGCLYLTVLASPVYAEYRYVYGIMISIPVLICWVLLDSSGRKGGDENKIEDADTLD